MEDKFTMREMIDKAKEALGNHDGMWEYRRLSTKETGINMDLYIDDNAEYKHGNHPLWAWCVYENHPKVPIFISTDPKAIITEHLNNDIQKELYYAFKFIAQNKETIEEYANGKIHPIVLRYLLKPISEDNDVLLNEMATISPSLSGLPVLIWVDENKLPLPHATRIKFRAYADSDSTREDPSMEIIPPHTIHNLDRKRTALRKKDIDKIRRFVETNQDLLIKLCNKEILYHEFIEQIQKIDSNGNPININPDYEIGRFVNGFSICKKDGKYDFMDIRGNLLNNGEFPYDKVSNFEPFNGGYDLFAFVEEGGIGYYINTNGTAVKFGGIDNETRANFGL